MTRNIYEAVNKARAFFEIENYPGDFFSRLEKINYIDKYGVLLFKEDIDKLSGFIGYGINDIAVICVNYKRSYGHQNFTLAHEFGHLFLHKGVSISDDDRVLAYSNEKIEQEANEFASELLYPVKLLSQDYNCAVQQDLFNSKNRKKLGEYIDKLCHKYCLSYEMVLRKLLYKNRQAKKYKTIRKEIEKAILVSDIGITPTNDGKAIRLNFPDLTEERRKELAKDVKKRGEEAKVAVRNIRRDANDFVKKQNKAGDLNDDQAKDEEDKVQKMTDKYIKQIDEAVEAKSKEIMTV